MVEEKLEFAGLAKLLKREKFYLVAAFKSVSETGGQEWVAFASLEKQLVSSAVYKTAEECACYLPVEEFESALTAIQQARAEIIGGVIEFDNLQDWSDVTDASFIKEFYHPITLKK